MCSSAPGYIGNVDAWNARKRILNLIHAETGRQWSDFIGDHVREHWELIAHVGTKRDAIWQMKRDKMSRWYSAAIVQRTGYFAFTKIPKVGGYDQHFTCISFHTEQK